MRIAFDGTTLQPRRTGVGYYTEHLLQHLALQVAPGELVVVSNRPPDTAQALPESVEVAVAGSSLVRLLWMQTMAPCLLRSVGADVAHFTNGMIPLATRVPTVVTIHDVSLTLYPECHPRRRLLLNRPLVRLAAQRAGAIITVSHSARRDIVRVHNVDPSRVHVVHEAAAPIFRPVTDAATLDAVRRRHRLPDRFVLSVGALEPRKNLPRLLEAFARRKRAGDLPQSLVCVGPYGWLSRDLDARITALGLDDYVRFTGYVPFEDLPAIYSLCEMFVFPSIYEGFGLPVMEAMACGAAVIFGRGAALTEIAGDACVDVDPLDVDAIGDAMVALDRDGERRRALGARGLARAREFSWHRAAQETLGVYRTVLARQPAVRRRSIAPGGHARPVPDHSVLLGQAYYLRFDPKLWEAQQPYPPLGTLYAASYLRARGHRVAVFDAMLATSESEWAEALDRHRPRVAVLYEDNFNYLTKMCLLRMREAALTMIRAARARDIPVVVAGSDATDHPAIYLDAGASCVVLGEGEVTLGEVVTVLQGSRERLKNVAGVCFRDADGIDVRTRAREPVRQLDDLPRPAWDLVDVERYRSIWQARHGLFSMHLSTTRGCPYHCNWCAKPIYGQRYAARSPAAVAEEIAWLRQQYRPDHLWITDDIFGLAPGWIEAFADALADRRVAIPFKCLMRADQVTGRVVAALARAACRTVWLGAESGSQRILDAMDKGIKVAQVEEAAGRLRAAGIAVGFFLQFGYPGETRDDINQTLDMVRRARPDDIGVSISYPLPGTPFHDRVRAQLGPRQNWVDSSDLGTMYRATYSTEFYRVLHQAVHAEFRVRKATTLTPVLRRPWTLRRAHVRQAASIARHLCALPLLRRRLDHLSRLDEG